MRISRDVDLRPWNTFGLKVRAAYMVEYDSEPELAGLKDVLRQTGALPVLHIGRGSNLLFTGETFPGILIHSNIRHFRVLTAEAPDGDVVVVEAGAGITFDEVCRWASEQGLWGLENLSGIPGEVGASAVQNIGAYGVEVKDVIRRVHCWDMVLDRMVSFAPEECGYGYRDSLFKRDRKGRYIVTSVEFALSRDPRPRLDYGHIRSAVETASGGSLEVVTPGVVRRVVLDIRNAKLPDPEKVGNAGSFFKNPVVPRSAYDKVARLAPAGVPMFDMGSGFVKIPAAWLIEQCGWKGYRKGNVGVWERQPLVIVNATGDATGAEIAALEAEIVSSVRERFDILLHPEVEHV